MFSIFKKKKAPDCKNIIWYSEEAKLFGLLKAIEEKRNDEILIIMSSFSADLKLISNVLSKKGIDIEPLTSLSGFRSGKVLHTYNTEHIINSLGQINNQDGVRVIFLEPYPIKTKNELIIENVVKQLPNAVIEIYISLDDPIMRMFGSERIKELLEKMGIKKDETLQHSMISKSIERAQQKIQQQVKFEQNAESAEKWFELNIKQ